MLLWRYLDLPAWNRLASRRELPLSRIASFEDAFECLVPFVAASRRKLITDTTDFQKLYNTAARLCRSWASCWFAAEHESIAMWDLHVGRRNPGVAISVLYTDLQFLAPSKGRVAPVAYHRHDDDSADIPIDRPDAWPFIKLMGYRHEREVRLIVPDEDESVSSEESGRWGHLVPSDLHSVIRSARVFSPRNEEVVEMEKAVAEALPSASVARSTAYPTVYKGSWVYGMEPGHNRAARMQEVPLELFELGQSQQPASPE